jgi:hypothetical protein
MKALISMTESRESGYRVVQVEPDDRVFDVATGFVWTDCPDYIVANQYYYNQENDSFVEYTEPTPTSPALTVTKESLMRELAMLAARIEALDSGTGAANTQPAVTGADTL